MASSYKELQVWQKAMALAAEIYQATSRFPQNEMYGLTNQLRRAAVSVPSNIAEGQGRLKRGEFLQFLGNARGSLYELETQLTLAVSLGYATRDAVERLHEQSAEISRMLNGLILSLKRVETSQADVAKGKLETRNTKLET